MGVPFNGQIDVWSVGIILLEMSLGRPLFDSISREQQIEAISTTIAPLTGNFFKQGKYADIKVAQPVADEDIFGLTCRNIHKLLNDHAVTGYPPEFIHFCASLLQVNPMQRMTPLEALQHTFLSRVAALPLSIYCDEECSRERMRYEMEETRSQCAVDGLKKLRGYVRRPAIIPLLPKPIKTVVSSSITSPNAQLTRFGRPLNVKQTNLSDMLPLPEDMHDNPRRKVVVTDVHDSESDVIVNSDDDEAIYIGGKRRNLQHISSRNPKRVATREDDSTIEAHLSPPANPLLSSRITAKQSHFESLTATVSSPLGVQTSKIPNKLQSQNSTPTVVASPVVAGSQRKLITGTQSLSSLVSPTTMATMGGSIQSSAPRVTAALTNTSPPFKRPMTASPGLGLMYLTQTQNSHRVQEPLPLQPTTTTSASLQNSKQSRSDSSGPRTK